MVKILWKKRDLHYLRSINVKKMEELGKNIVSDSAERMVLRTEGLVKRYGKRTVVNNVSFDVKQGEIVGLLGPNGAGKTTSFYMTTGLVVPNGGRIFMNDLEITDYPVYFCGNAAAPLQHGTISRTAFSCRFTPSGNPGNGTN